MTGGLRARAIVRIDGFDLDVELGIEPGETVALLGPNGAGKSTTVRALTGLQGLSDGYVELDGDMVDSPSKGTFVPTHERRIGTVFQDALLFPHLSVADNVGFGVERPMRRSVATTWLDRVGLSGFEDRSVTDLSGGEARRVAIARALALDPALVILDEPFAGLDVGARAELRRILSTELAGESARLLVTHDPAEARTLADRVVILEAGRVTQHGTPAEVQRRPASRFIADLVGVNLFVGNAANGRVRVDDTELELRIADPSLAGPVRLTIAPSAVALHASAPSGSPRNSWSAHVADIHQLGQLVRVHLDSPAPVVVDVTPGAVAELGLAVGGTVWVAVKATAFDVVASS